MRKFTHQLIKFKLMREFTHQLIKSQSDEKKKEEPESGSSSKFFFKLGSDDRVKFHINYINSYQYQYTLAFGNLVPFRNISLNTCIIKKYL
jgi:hypothetical protein